MTKTFLGYDLEWNMKGCKIGLVLQKIDGIDIWSGKCGARYPNYYLSSPRYRNGLKQGQRKTLDQNQTRDPCIRSPLLKRFNYEARRIEFDGI